MSRYCQCGCKRKTTLSPGYRVEDRGHKTLCWVWQGWKNPKGYGHIAGHLAHYHYYRLAKGPVPDGLTLDHLCRQRDCVNPDHLESVPHRVNVMRGNFHRQAIADPQTPAEIARAMRIRRGLSQGEVAARLNVSRSLVGYWERGERSRSLGAYWPDLAELLAA